MFRRSAAALMPKPESEPLLFRAERIRAKTGESGPVPRSPVPSGRKDAAFRAIFLPSLDCMLNLQTVWRSDQDLNFQGRFSSARRQPNVPQGDFVMGLVSSRRCTHRLKVVVCQFINRH